MTDHSGKSGLAKRTDKHSASLLSLGLTLALALLLSACASAPTPPAPVEDRTEVEREIREPAEDDSEGVQVFPLQNPAVKTLLAQAGEAETSGNYDEASVLLERALRIQPHDPELLQQMAEVQVRKRDYQQALNFAVRSYDAGPRVGEICARNWRTIGLAREHLGDADGAREAESRVGQCMNTRPQRY